MINVSENLTSKPIKTVISFIFAKVRKQGHDIGTKRETKLLAFKTRCYKISDRKMTDWQAKSLKNL